METKTGKQLKRKCDNSKMYQLEQMLDETSILSREYKSKIIELARQAVAEEKAYRTFQVTGGVFTIKCGLP